MSKTTIEWCDESLNPAAGGEESEWAPDLQGLRAFPIPAPLDAAQRRHLGIPA